MSGVVGARSGHFEWLLPFERLEPHFCALFARHGLARGEAAALVLGCGTSNLSAELVQAGGLCSRCVSVDDDASVIQHMRERCEDGSQRLCWLKADLNDPRALAVAGVRAGEFDVVVDKSTLDAMLCSEDASGVLCTAAAALRVGGLFISVSLYGEALLRKLLADSPVGSSAFAAADFEFRSYERAAADGARAPRVSVVCMRKCANAADEHGVRRAMRDHIARTLDWFHREHQPLLTCGRERELRAAFTARCAACARASSNADAGAGAHAARALPLADAYDVMFGAEERSEYCFEDFEHDAMAMRCGDGSGSMHSGGSQGGIRCGIHSDTGGSSGSGGGSSDLSLKPEAELSKTMALTLDEALAFLRANQ
eukprot:g5598.t1